MSTDEKQLEYAKKHQSKLYRVPVYIPKEQKEPLQKFAADKGFDSLNAYIKHLLKKDSGIEL